MAGDVGAWVFIKSGTNWIPGWYKIASVAANAATLNAASGAGVTYASTTKAWYMPTSSAGCATVASPTAATWGIDYSQQAASQFSSTTFSIDASVNTTLRDGTNTIGKNWIGNSVSITTGTGFTVQRVVVQSTSGTAATVDKSLGTLGSTNGTGKFGGAIASPGLMGSLLTVTGMAGFIKSGSYSITSASTNVSGGCITANTSINQIYIVGYNSVRMDFGTRPLLTASGISTFTIINCSSTGAGWFVANIAVDGGSLTSSAGIITSRTGSSQMRNKASNCKNVGLSSQVLLNCEATGCSTTAPAILFTISAIACESHGNSVTGIDGAGTGLTTAVDCLSYSNTGASSDGFGALVFVLANCTAYGNGRNGFSGSNNGSFQYAYNCIAEANASYGFSPQGGNNAPLALTNFATYNNTSGAVLYGNGTGQRAVNVNPIAGPSSFFVNAAGGNFALNNVTGAGAACRAAGYVSSFPSGTTVNYADIGAAQSRAVRNLTHGGTLA